MMMTRLPGTRWPRPKKGRRKMPKVWTARERYAHNTFLHAYEEACLLRDIRELAERGETDKLVGVSFNDLDARWPKRYHRKNAGRVLKNMARVGGPLYRRRSLFAGWTYRIRTTEGRREMAA